MALSVDYVVRETATNLRRNLLMTFASVLTVFLSLALVGGALLLKQGVARTSAKWRGGVELEIFMKPDASPSESEAIEKQLSAMPDVRTVTYIDQQAAYKEFRRLFDNSPDITEAVVATDLPPSYRVVPRRAELTKAVGDRFKDHVGVYRVEYAKDAIDSILKVTHYLQLGIVVIAGILLFSASLLILNTIRMAIYARRREVAVMKLVGATNWFIRVPFMLEGLVQGILGAAFAFFVLFLLRGVVAGWARRNPFELLNQLIASSHDVIGTGIFILIMGAIVGAVGSAFAVRRFLDV